MKKVYFSHGEKGGCGKSMTALLAIETLFAMRGTDALIAIETDTSNPDFARKARELPGLTLEFCNLREQSGWNELVDLIERADEGAQIMVNLPSQVGLWDSEIEVLADALDSMAAEVVVFWTINRQRDSVTLLNKAMAKSPENFSWVVVKNLYFGSAEKFELFDIDNASRTPELKVLHLPEAPDFFVDHVMKESVTFSTVATKDGFTAYERSQAKRLLATAQKEFGRVL